MIELNGTGSNIAAYVTKLTEGGFYRQLVCSRFWLGCVIGMYFKNKKR